MKIENEFLKEARHDWLRVHRIASKRHLERIKELENSASKIVPLKQSLNIENVFLGYDADKLFVKIKGDKKSEFSLTVRKLSRLLGEPPNINVRTKEYIAEFTESKVHVYLSDASDCQMVETKETVKVYKPHPGCLAALKELEQI